MMLRASLGRSLTYKDMPTVRRIVREAAKQDYRFSALVWSIVNTEQFRMRRVPGSVEQPITARNDQ